MNYVVFGDESTLPQLRRLLGRRMVFSVVASNRPQAVEVIDATTVVQPPKKAAERTEFIARLKGAKADAFLCFSYSMILDEEMLALPRLGAINVHGGLLPAYRGANVLNWAIIEDAPITGVTAHYMTAGIDEGDIICSRTTSIGEHDTAATLKVRLDVLGQEMLAGIIDKLEAGEVLPRALQDSSQVRYYRRRKPKDGFIDWEKMSDRQVFNLVRALVRPWPGAFTVTPDGGRIVFDRYITLQEVAELRKKYSRGGILAG